MTAALKVAIPVLVSTGTSMLYVRSGSATDITGARSGFVIAPATGEASGNNPINPMTLEEIEDQIDIAAARAALAEPTASMSYEDARRALGLK